MNERIRELAEQVYGSAHYDDFKFAELIVGVCADIAFEATYRHATDEVAYDVKNSVQKHFGVES